MNVRDLLVPPLSAIAILATAGCGGIVKDSSRPGVKVEPARVLDLTYDFGPDTIYWPTSPPFRLERVAYGKTPSGYWYAANTLCLAEHGGTHMDAPIHFAEGGWSAEAVPLSSLIGPAVVIDVRNAASQDRDYLMTVEDVLAWENRYGRLPKGAIVIAFTGWGRFWGNKRAYLGSDVPGDTKNLHFPGVSPEAAKFLVTERDIAAVGIDTASVDHGPSQDFLAHRILNGANKPVFENMANVDLIPPFGATVVALPMKIRGGSGGPARIIAILPGS